MSNRRFEVFEYRHVIDNMRKGMSDRSIASKGLMGRAKCKVFSEPTAILRDLPELYR